MPRRSQTGSTPAPHQNPLDEAIRLHQGGCLEDAAALYRKILAAKPDHADALHLLGVVAQQQGRVAEAIELIGRALLGQPRNAVFHSNLSLALRAAGRSSEAAGHLRKALEIDPTYLAAAKNLATILQELGQLDEAEQAITAIAAHHPREASVRRIHGLVQIRQGKVSAAEATLRIALELEPEDAESLNNLGLALKEQRRLGEAEGHLRRALALKPDAANVLTNLGLLCGEQGRLDEAETFYREALRIDPRAIRTLNNLAVTLKQAGRLDQAEESLLQALEIDPHDVGTRTNLGDVLNTLGRYAEARPHLEEAVRLDPRCAEAHNNLAVTLKEAGQPADSLAHLEHALKCNPNYTPALTNLGNALVAQGDVAGGAVKFLRVLELNPHDVPALFSLATSTRHSLTDSEIKHMQEILAGPRVRADEAELLHFALASVLDKQGAADQAFAHAAAGNKSKRDTYRRRGLGFDQAEHQALCDDLCEVFSSANFARLPSSELINEQPVFIVGMPRSGTTLVEQILASHPSVFGAGELGDIPQIAADLPQLLKSPRNYPRCLDRLDSAKAREVAQKHLDHLRELSGGAARAVDKMTINFLHLGLIALLFPKARIIHCRRDPRDICLSCFFHNFAGAGLNFTLAWEDLGFYYRQYERLMKHWRTALPLPIFEIEYEEHVREPEKWTRALLEFCGIPWDDRCLAFHQTERQVKTASALQVRQPMYTRSIGRWKAYETHLQPLVAALRETSAGASEATAPDEVRIPLPRLLETAIKLHQSGEHDTARSYYQRILREKPDHPDALHLTGALDHHEGRHAEALDRIQQAISIKPDNAAYHSNAGLVLRALGHLEQARAALSRAVELDPSYGIAHRNLGIVLRELERFEESGESFQRVLALDSRDTAAWRNLGLTLLARGRPAEAVDAFHRALSINPADFEAHHNIGLGYKELGRLAESEVSYREAVRLRPDHPSAHNNLGIVLTAMGRSDEAQASFTEALRRQPDHADARHNLGAALAELGRHSQAIEHFRAVLNLDANNAEYHNSLGASLQALGSPREALASYNTALSLNPAHAWAHFNRSQALLLLGQYEEGWREWEWRWQLPGVVPRRYDAPAWDGRPRPDGAVLLHTEQGLGDTIHFSRFCRLVKKRVSRVIVECQPALVPLLVSCEGIDSVVGRGDPLPAFDAYAPLMSVPVLLGLSDAGLELKMPYLSVDAGLTETWRQRLDHLAGLRIGIAWQGNPKHRHDRFRSVDVSLFAALAAVADVQLVNLQKGPARKDLARCNFRVHDPGEIAESFVDTAAIMETLDLVISVDTAVAHLAGALDLPVWLALPYAPDWRWRQEGGTTPWYPSMRLFRQPAQGSWEPVFDTMRDELARLTARREQDGFTPVEIPISPGELIDRITISEIRAEQPGDSVSLTNLRRHLEILCSLRDRRLQMTPQLSELTERLREVNRRRERSENEIRAFEEEEDFGPRFLELYQAIRRDQDLRCSLRREIDRLLGCSSLDGTGRGDVPSP